MRNCRNAHAFLSRTRAKFQNVWENLCWQIRRRLLVTTWLAYQCISILLYSLYFINLKLYLLESTSGDVVVLVTLSSSRRWVQGEAFNLNQADACLNSTHSKNPGNIFKIYHIFVEYAINRELIEEPHVRVRKQTHSACDGYKIW